MLVDDAQIDGLVDAFVEHVMGAPVTPRRERYFECLNRVQRCSLRFHRGVARPVLTVALNGVETRAILSSLMLSEELRGAGPLQPLAPRTEGSVTQCIVEAEALLRAYDATAARYVGDLIGEIILLRNEGFIAGSFWHLLGVIWMSPGTDWAVVDYAEAMLHEAVHQSMFLNDMVRGLFKTSEDELRSPELLVMSPIRGVRRPYDAAFHAATVSTTLTHFHEWTGRQDRARSLCTPLLVTLAELYERRRVLTEAGREVLDAMLDATESSVTFRGLVQATSAS